MKTSWLLALSVAALGCGAPRGNTGDKGDEGRRGDADAIALRGASPDENTATGRFRGYAETNRIVNERLFARRDAVSISAYFEARAEDSLFFGAKPTLAALLGQYDGDGLRTEIENASPNAVNMLLWYLAFDGLSRELTVECAEGGAQPERFALADLRPDFQGSVARLCLELAAGNVADGTYRDLYQAALGVDAPATELESWTAFARGESFVGKTPRDTAQELLMAALYNPYFLLDQ